MSETILELDSIVGGYGRITILNGTSFAVQRGTLTTVIGPNGAGKSTVFKAIFGLLNLRSGTIRFEGRDITGWKPRQLLEAASFTYRRGATFSRSSRFGTISNWGL